MKTHILVTALLLLGACATTSPYGPAAKEGAKGYTTQQIEQNRFRVSYTAKDAGRARDYALLRAAEVTLDTGADWFDVTHSYSDGEDGRGARPRTSVSIGGSVGSGGYRGGGVGIGIGLPVSGGRGGVTAVLEIVTGRGQKPERPSVYNARAVSASLRGLPE